MANRSLFDTVTQRKLPRETPSLFEGVTVGGDAFTSANPGSYGSTGLGDSRHDWGIKADEIYTLADRRAARQTVGEQFGSFINQAVIGEIAGGTIEGIGYLLDLDSYGKLLSGTETEFGNWFSDIGKSMRTWTEESTPIYTDPDQNKFAPGHFSWWMKNGKSVASTLSLMIPAAGAIKGISAVGKALGMFQKMSPMASWMAKGLSQAAVSRHMENMMEASGVQKESYNKAISKGMSPSEAEEYAARAASKTYALDWAMFLQDVPQYLLLNRAFGKASVGLAEKSIGAAAAMGHKLAPVIGSKAAAIGWDMLGEGFEEGYQFIAAEEAKYMAEKTRDPKSTSSFNERLTKYLGDGEFWTNAAMGALGAGVMQTAGKAINDLIQGGDAQTKAVKQFGAEISHAAQQVQFSDILGSESGKRAAITNLETVMLSKHASLGTMDDYREMIKRSANPSEADLTGILKDMTPEAIELMKENAPEILKHADEYQALWEKNANKQNGAQITNEEFLIDTYNGYKNDYKSRLDALKDNITNYNSLSYEAKDIFAITSQILANNKKIAFQEKLIADTKNPLNKAQKKQAEELIARAKKTDAKLRGDLKTVEESRNEATREYDDSINIGGPYNLLEAKSEKDITGHSILEYLKLDESLAFADDTLTASQRRLKDLLSDKKQPKQPEPEKSETQRIPETDDYVTYTIDGKEHTGIVDSIDENGDYVINPTMKWTPESKIATQPTGEVVTVSKDKVVLDKKIYTEDDTIEEALDKTEFPDKPEDVDASVDIFLDATYMQYVSGMKVPGVRNEALHRFLVASRGNLEGVRAEMYIDFTSEWAENYFKEKGITSREINRMKEGILTAAEVDDIFTRASADTMPIEILLIKDGKPVVQRGGLYYHTTSFKRKSVPEYVEDKDAYLKDQENKLRKSRRFI
jgi:hypothetical protein